MARPDVLEQGQHGKLAGATHYIKSLNVPPALQMTIAKARYHMKVSRMVQLLVGLNPMGDGLDDELLQKSPAYRWRQNEQKALAEARCLVVSHYGLGSRMTSKEILARCPFINGNKYDEEASFVFFALPFIP
jgi:hypothetical protein